MSNRALARLSCLVSILGIAACGDLGPGVPPPGTAAPIPRGGDVSATCASATECRAAGTTSPVDRSICTSDDECDTKACGDDHRCATAPSCTRTHGGRTCGPDGTNDDCCAVVTQGPYKIDKYLITAGRMRAFIEKLQGNIRGFVGSLPPDRWKPEWNEADSLPSDKASSNELLGAYANKKSCNQGPYTGHTYWTPKTEDDYSDFDQDTLDEKALNCVPWPLMQALCVWEGGHLATLAELKAAFTNDGTTKYPWGDDGLESVSTPDPQERLNIEFGFATSPLPATFRKDKDGNPQEVSFRISPPGRYPKGNNKAGISDSAGNLLEWVGDELRQFVWKADFEHHAANAAGFNGGNWWWEKPLPFGGPFVWGTNQLVGQAGSSAQKNGYYSIGGRCAH